YPEPLAPNLAARRAGVVQVDRVELVDWIRRLDDPDRVVVVEGAGGLLVRFADDFTLAEVVVDLSAPLCVVTSLVVGRLNGAAIAVGQAHRCGIHVAGLIGGSLPAEPELATQLNIEELEEVTGSRLWGCIPHGVAAMGAQAFGETVGTWPCDAP